MSLVPIPVGRPRTVGINASGSKTTTAKSLAQQPTAEALDMAIASILPPSSAPAALSPVGTSSSNAANMIAGGIEILSTFEVQPNMILKPISLQSANAGSSSAIRKIHTNTATVPMINSNASNSSSSIGTPIVLSQLTPGTSQTVSLGGFTSNVSGTLQKIKVMPGNHFVKIKPPGLNTQKLYTLNSSSASVSNAAKAPTMYTIRGQSSSAGSVAAGGSGGVVIGTQPIAGGSSSTDPGKHGKVFTVKSSPIGTQLLSASGALLNLKAGTHFTPVSSGSPIAMRQMISVPTAGGGSMMLSPKKYTFLKQTPGGTLQSTTATGHPQFIKLKPATAVASTSAAGSGGDLTSANIFDLPIVFADNEGNIQDNASAAVVAGAATSSPAPTSTAPTVYLSAGGQHLSAQSASASSAASTTSGSVLAHLSASGTSGPNRNIIINTSAPRKIQINTQQMHPLQSQPGNKVVLINRPMKGVTQSSIQIGGSMANVTMLPANSIVGTTAGGGSTMQKFTKVNVSNASSIGLPVRTNIEVVRAGQLGTTGQFKAVTGNLTGGTFTLGNKVNLLSNAVIRPAGSALSTDSVAGSTMRTFNLTGAKVVSATNANVTGSIVSASGSASGSTSGQYNPIVINVDSDKTTTGIKNIIKVGDTQIKPTNTIVLKSGSLRPMLKPNILNRNVTVRKLNLVPQQLQQQVRTTNIATTGPPTMTTTSATIVRQATPGTSSTQQQPLQQGSQIVLQMMPSTSSSQSSPKPTAEE